MGSVYTESYHGSDCTGSSGDSSRTLTLANTALTLPNGFLLSVGGLILSLTDEYTISHLSASTVITFVNPVFDDQAIVVTYYTGGVSDVGQAFNVSARFIQKNLAYGANTCTIIEVSKSTGTDEYRTITETNTNNTNINCWVNILSEADELVKAGTFRSGDLVFWFDSDNESLCVQGNRITFDSKTYEIYEVRKFDIMDTTMIIECRTKQV